MAIRVLLVEDHDLIRHLTRSALEQMPGYQVVGEARTGEQALESLALHQPDLVLLDLRLKGLSGMNVLKAAKQRCSAVRVVVVSAFDSPHLVREALECGADGYLTKEASWNELVVAIQTVLEGRRYIQGSVAHQLLHSGVDRTTLTVRERQVLSLAAEGLSNKEIAGRLRVSTRTVEVHMANAMAKLGAGNRMQAVRLAQEQGELHV